LTKKKPNKLISETSPYLLQHLYNPVEWYPWGEDAFNEARRQNKPIFLSIGYSSCYWCHVMARESFENEDIAELMNKYFINIKVDREERPEIDRIYMIALQSMLGYGGWPLNIFLNHNLKPFYGFTYLPPKAKYGRSGLEDVLNQVNNLWLTKQKEINESAEKIFLILKNKTEYQKANDESTTYEEIIKNCFESAKRYYDFENGGFGNTNKFPRPPFLNFLMKYYYYYNDKEALDIVTHTLKSMYNGGIFDHLEGGFHRYSIDKYWRIPHFEKMIYDQAQLISTYLDAFKITKEELFLEVALKITKYSLEKLYNPEGGFFSSEDAESINDKGIKEEGYYYLWKYKDIENILNKDEFNILTYHFGIKYEGNILPEFNQDFRNSNILYINNDVFDTAKHFSISVDKAKEILKTAIEKLIIERKKRIKPDVDKKIITSWNGMMVKAILEVYQITSDNKYLSIAEKTLQFIFDNLYDSSENILYHSFKDGVKVNQGNLEDYAHIINSLIKLYEMTNRADYLIRASELLKRTIDLFYDYDLGGFWDTPINKENLILKTKDITDTSEPSANSIILEIFLKLKILNDRDSYDEKIIKALEYFTNSIADSPYSHPQMISDLLLYLKGNTEIIFSPDSESDFIMQCLQLLSKKYIPFYSIYYVNDELANQHNIFKNYNIKGNNIFICNNFKCEKPINTLEELKQFLSGITKGNT